MAQQVKPGESLAQLVERMAGSVQQFPRVHPDRMSAHVMVCLRELGQIEDMATTGYADACAARDALERQVARLERSDRRFQRVTVFLILLALVTGYFAGRSGAQQQAIDCQNAVTMEQQEALCPAWMEVGS